MPTKKPKPDLVKAADEFARKYEDVFGDKDPQDIINELRGDGDVPGDSMNSSRESAAREQWMDMAAREVWLNLPESCAVTELFIAAIIARHYAKRAREEWIPVSERLPRDRDIVNVLEKLHQDEPSVAQFRQGEWELWGVDGLQPLECVTHWCPLPAPPFAAKGEADRVAAQGEQHDH